MGKENQRKIRTKFKKGVFFYGKGTHLINFQRTSNQSECYLSKPQRHVMIAFHKML